MTIGNLDSGLPGGSGYVHGQRNYFCRDCGNFNSAGEREPDPQRCATPGCIRLVGFGRYAQIEATRGRKR